MQGTKAIAQRIVNAEENFAETIMAIASCSKADAFKVLAIYRKAKAMKLDAVGGRYIAKHGAFYDVEVIKRAIAQ